MSRRTLLALLGGGVAFALLLAAPLFATRTVGNPLARTLGRVELWRISGGATFQCCKLIDNCYNPVDCIEHYVPFCSTNYDYEAQTGNSNSCSQSPEEEDECEHATTTHFCMKRQVCTTGTVEGQEVCVNNHTVPWEFVQNAPDSCTGPECSQ